ncbi:MAG: DUF4276 family protein [Myxococcales bacterium]|nr:DUF4276 family protein [Myxococcales bacterium]MCB9700789.1 DUF4276 family protein [Myxococcales bacterium]
MQRVTLFIVVEGYSESGFFGPFLAEHLGTLGIDLHVPVIGKGKAKGGMLRSFSEVCRELGYFLADRRRPVVTTFFDYYGFPEATRLGWDFVAEAKSKSGVEGLEARLRESVLAASPDADDRFIPYVQMHELEALYFAEPTVFAEVLETPALSGKLEKIALDSGGCEAINDSPTTAPSKRLEKMCSYKKGRKAAGHAPRLGKRMALDRVRLACPRFNEWLTRLEALAPRDPTAQADSEA